MGTSQTVPTATGWPMRMEELVEGERLLIWSYRRWVVGMRTHDETHWSMVSRELGCSLGLDGARTVLGGLNRMIRELAFHARRPVRLHPPCCGMVCADEMSLVALAAACQRRDHHCARGIAERLVRPEGVGDAIEAGRIVGEGLDARSFVLPDRMSSGRPGPTDAGMAQRSADNLLLFRPRRAEFAARRKARP